MSYFEIPEYTQSMIAYNILTGYLLEFWSNICIADAAILQPNKQFSALFSLTKVVTCMLSSVLTLKIL